MHRNAVMKTDTDYRQLLDTLHNTNFSQYETLTYQQVKEIWWTFNLTAPQVIDIMLQDKWFSNATPDNFILFALEEYTR
jgi:hypothetical protein